jgi:hypothetical protein
MLLGSMGRDLMGMEICCGLDWIGSSGAGDWAETTEQLTKGKDWRADPLRSPLG